MDAFLASYPWIVLGLGLWSAFAAILVGAYMSVMVLSEELWDRLAERRVRLWAALAFTSVGDGAAICILAFTKWMLAACA